MSKVSLGWLILVVKVSLVATLAAAHVGVCGRWGFGGRAGGVLAHARQSGRNFGHARK
jgi:hypothetical protein